MESICRSCLVKCNDASEMLKYSEKNRRLFLYSTGIQVKRDDVFVFQLCRDCHLNMKVACKFKKSCRLSERKFKSYLCSKELDANIDFSIFANRTDDSVNLRLPKSHNDISYINKTKEDDNVSTSTSIRNFLKDILQGDEIPDSEARIINEVIQEEADLSDDSLDTHWLQDDVSMVTDFRFDFCLSPFSTTHSISNDHCYTLPVEYQNNTNYENKRKLTDNNDIQSVNISNVKEKPNITIDNNEEINSIHVLNIRDDSQNMRCVIDKNLDKALLDESTDNFALDELLATPPMISNSWTPSTPTINNILFGDKLDSHKRPGQNIEKYEEVRGTVDVLDEFLTFKDSNDLVPKANILHNKTNSDLIIGESSQKLWLDESSQNTAPKEYDQRSEQDQCNELLQKDEHSSNISLSGNSSSNEQVFVPHATKHVEIKDTNQKIIIKIIRKQEKDHGNNEAVKDNITNGTPEPLLFVKYSKIEDQINKLVQGIDNTETECSNNLDLCNFKDESNFKSEDINGVVTKDRDIIKQPLSPIENNYCLETISCKLCERTFKKAQNLKTHMTKKHRITIKTPYIRSHVKRICNYCGKEFTSSISRFLKHIQNHEKPVTSHICKVCHLTFNTKARLTMHQNSHTGNQVKKPVSIRKKHMCEHCGGSFTLSNYKIHMRRHTKEYAFKCVECDAGFYRKTDLTLHIRTHTGERPLTCNYCSRAFKRRDVLNIHIRRHTGERPFKCTICDKAFITSVNLRTHQSRAKECLMMQEKIAFPDKMQQWVTID